MDAGLAKVLNSTIGTSAVKALDTLMKESDTANVEKLNGYMTTIANNAADRLYNKLKADVKLVGSDEVILHYDGGWKEGSNAKYRVTTQGVSFSHNGAIIAKTFQSNSGSGEKNYRLNAYAGSATGATIAASGNVSVPSGQSVEISIAFNVAVGTKYYIELYSSDTAPADTVDFCGTLVQFSPTATMATS